MVTMAPDLGDDHRLDGVVDPEIGALDVDREGAVPRRLLDRIDRAAGRHAGRRQQHVDAAPFLHDLGHAGARLGIAADVGGQDDGAAAARLDVGRDLAQPDLVLVDQGKPRTLGGEQAGRGRADARRRAGDDGYFVLELHGASLAREACAAPASRRTAGLQARLMIHERAWRPAVPLSSTSSASAAAPACSAPRSGPRRPWRRRCSPWARARPRRRPAGWRRSSAGSPAPA